MSANEYTDVSFDEFEKKTTFRHKTKVGSRSFRLRRDKTATSDVLVLEIGSNYPDAGWMERAIFSYDGATVDAKFYLDDKRGPYLHGLFLIGNVEGKNKQILEQICRASILKARFYLSETTRDEYGKEGADLLNHFREFYSDVYESKEFSETIRSYRIANPAADQSKGCFIATAAMGSDAHPDVLLLRRFRDDWLLRGRFSDIGRYFVETYYRGSPPIANFIAKRRMLRPLFRMLLIKPLSFVASILL